MFRLSLRRAAWRRTQKRCARRGVTAQRFYAIDASLARRAAVDRAQKRSTLAASCRAARRQRRHAAPRARATLLLLPLRAAQKRPTPRRPTSSGRRTRTTRTVGEALYAGLLKASSGPEAEHVLGLRRLPKTVKYCMTTFPEETSSENEERMACLDLILQVVGLCVFDACVGDALQLPRHVPEHPPDVEFPYDDYLEESTHPEKPDADYWESLKTSRTSGATSRTGATHLELRPAMHLAAVAPRARRTGDLHGSTSNSAAPSPAPSRRRTSPQPAPGSTRRRARARRRRPCRGRAHTQ